MGRCGAWGTTAAVTIDGYTGESPFGVSITLLKSGALAVGASDSRKAFVFDLSGTLAGSLRSASLRPLLLAAALRSAARHFTSEHSSVSLLIGSDAR